MTLSIFPSWIGGYEIKQHITNPNIEVGDYSYYSGYYHQHHFEDQCVHYLLGDKSSNEVWQGQVFLVKSISLLLRLALFNCEWGRDYAGR